MREWHIVTAEKVRERERANQAEKERDALKAELERLRAGMSGLGNTEAEQQHDF